jgi:hypothetical protein
VIALWLIECAPKPAETEPSKKPPIPLTAIPLNGAVDHGVYKDSSLPLSVRIPDGWTAAPGATPSPLRVSLTNADLGLRVEIWSDPRACAALREREGCLWTFDDVGDYRVFDGAPVRVATCTPDDPDDPRVLATQVERGGITYQIDASIPEASFVAGKEAVRGVLDGIEWR